MPAAPGVSVAGGSEPTGGGEGLGGGGDAGLRARNMRGVIAGSSIGVTSATRAVCAL